MASEGPWGHWNGSATPTFVYVADQVDRHAALAAVPPNTFSGMAQDGTSRALREHSFHIGNDRVTLLGSNYGNWRLRADEGGPKILTDSDLDDVSATHHTYGGGLGYLLDSTGSVLCGTAYNGSESHPREREFGCGFGRTKSPKTTNGLSITHTVAVMPGRDPTVLIEATVTNAGSTRQSVSYVESWNTGIVHQLTGHGWGGWSRWRNMSTMLDRRAFVRAHYTSSYRNFSMPASAGGAIVGVVQSRSFVGLTAEERHFWRASYEGTWPLPVGASLWDEAPPALFLAILPPPTSAMPATRRGASNASGEQWHATSDVEASSGHGQGTPTPTVGSTSFLNSARAFYGTGGFAKPSGGRARWCRTVPEGETSLISVTPIELPPNSTATLRLVFGYLVGEEQRAEAMGAIVTRAAASFEPPSPADAAQVPAQVPLARDLGGISAQVPLARDLGGISAQVPLARVAQARWAPLLVKARVAGAPWVQRELAWHSHVLLAGVSFDSHMNESVVDQGTAYRYYAGFQGAVRDPLQHVLPLIASRPDLARSVIRLSVKQMQATPYTLDRAHPTLLPDSLIGSGVARSGSKGAPEPDDFELYLLLSASEYILQTKDVAFLSEPLPAYNTSQPRPLVAHLLHALGFVMDTVGRGPHGLLRLLSSDWCAGSPSTPASSLRECTRHCLPIPAIPRHPLPSPASACQCRCNCPSLP